MTTKDELLSELSEIKNSIQSNSFSISGISELMEKVDLDVSTLTSITHVENNSLIKNLMSTFNIKNYSDFTALVLTGNNNGISIIDFAGSKLIFNEFKTLYETDSKFYKDLENIKVKGSSFRLLYESMENEKGVYTIITLTESSYFKPSSFHMLSDIIMDIIRSTDMSRASIFNDLFEETIIGPNSFLASTDVVSLDFYLFKFENIYDFFLKMGLEIIIELSETIKIKLVEIFGDKTSIFRFSLSEYIVIAPAGSACSIRFSDLNNRNVIDFNYKGIVLQHRCIKIPHQNKQIYDVFETIFNIDNNL